MERGLLNGEWSLRSTDNAERLMATVPGCVHTDLLAAGKIEDPFYREQEFDAWWIHDKEWEYERTFTVDDALLGRDRVLLRCHGLDTLATIRLNGREIARTDNMHRLYEFDVKSRLRRGENRIQIRFGKALAHTETRQKERHLPGWRGTNQKLGYHGYIRKEQCNFGWDWGIRTVTCGIWRDIELIAFDTARLADVQVLQDHKSKKRVDLTVKIAAEVVGRSALEAKVTLRRADRVVAETTVPLRGGKGAASLTVINPELWWPNGMGEQNLYEVKVDLQCAGAQEAGSSSLDSWSRRIGLRVLRLDRHKDSWGESFQFTANGVPFFAKGANWIPSDAYLNRMTEARYRDLLESSKAAHMNVMRVWGGGIYEEDLFYELCDELGLCVWQDFMFACYTYPTWDDDFMANVKAEAEDAIRRLRHHACLALWCGNNELEMGLVADQADEGHMSWKEYKPLFDRLLPGQVAKFDGQTDYWPGSPHSTLGDRKDFNSPNSGDAHLWDVWHGKKPFEWYRTCDHRFNSEFGFQSFPEPKTVYGYTAPEDRNVTSAVMEHHQRSGIGNSTIMHYLLDWFRLPAGFDQTLWASQILQGMAIKYAVEHWRRSMPRGMGTVYWQLNDTWPVASWASIDYHHRWKALQYMAKKFFAPLLVSGLEDREKGTVEVHLTHDGLEARNLELRWTVTDAEGRRIDEGRKAVKSPRNGNRKVHTLRLKKRLAEQGERDLLVWLEVREGRTVLSDNLVYFARPKHLELSHQPDITPVVKAGKGDTFKVTLSCKATALWSWLELKDGDLRADDNFIHLRPGAPVTLTVTPSRQLSLSAFRKQLVVRSLMDLG